MVFLATPHSGADLAHWGDFLRVIVNPSPAATSLIRNDPNLGELNEAYVAIAKELGIDHLILTETKPLIWPSKWLWWTLDVNIGVIVKPDQGNPGGLGTAIPIPADHVSIAKPEDRTSDVYDFVKNFVMRAEKEKPSKPWGHTGRVSVSGPTALAEDILKEKLAVLENEWATTSDEAKRFDLEKKIARTKSDITKFGSKA